MSDNYTTPGWDWRTMINPDGDIIAAALAEQNRSTFDPRRLHTHRPAPPMNYEATNPWSSQPNYWVDASIAPQALSLLRGGSVQSPPLPWVEEMGPDRFRMEIPQSCPRCGSRLIEQDHRICSDLGCGWEMPLIRKADPS